MVAGKIVFDSLRTKGPKSEMDEVVETAMRGAVYASLTAASFGCCIAMTGVLTLPTIPFIALLTVSASAALGAAHAVWLRSVLAPATQNQETTGPIQGELTAQIPSVAPHMTPLDSAAADAAEKPVSEEQLPVSAHTVPGPTLPAAPKEPSKAYRKMNTILKRWEIKEHTEKNFSAVEVLNLLQEAHADQRKVLDLANRPLLKLPESAMIFEFVEEVILSNTNLAHRPDVLCSLPSLKRLDLRGNPKLKGYDVLFDNLKFEDGFEAFTGTVTKNDGRICSPRFIKGFLHAAEGKVTIPGIVEETGRWEDGKLSGEGVIKHRGFVLLGHWLDGQLDGQATVTTPDGTTATGRWAGGFPKGTMDVKTALGRSYQGVFRSTACSMHRPYKSREESSIGSVDFLFFTRSVGLHFSHAKASGQFPWTDEGIFYEGSFQLAVELITMEPLTRPSPSLRTCLYEKGTERVPMESNREEPFVNQSSSQKDNGDCLSCLRNFRWVASDVSPRREA